MTQNVITFSVMRSKILYLSEVANAIVLVCSLQDRYIFNILLLHGHVDNNSQHIMTFITYTKLVYSSTHHNAIGLEFNFFDRSRHDFLHKKRHDFSRLLEKYFIVFLRYFATLILAMNSLYTLKSSFGTLPPAIIQLVSLNASACFITDGFNQSSVDRSEHLLIFPAFDTVI